MSSVHVYLSVRFRAFGVTFGTVHREWEQPLPVFVPATKVVDFDERGIRLIVAVR